MEELIKYITNHTRRGACTCGKCYDAGENPKECQPDGHACNLTFFKVALQGDPDPKLLEAMLKDNLPYLLDGNDHSYVELGADIGSQLMALRLIALVDLCKLGSATSPDTMMPFLPEELKMQMAQNGMVSLKYNLQSEVK